MRFLFIFLGLFITFSVSAKEEQPSYVKGELLCQLYHFNDTAEIQRNTYYNLTFQVISKNNKVVRIKFDPSLGTITTLNEISTSCAPWILAIQKNHYTYLRSKKPNDSLYNTQIRAWSAVNAEKAWEKAQGGKTKKGDEIVLAIIDSGVDTAHQDLARNLWRNLSEIPYDGIDNDQNGYVDDYYGWNIGDSTPTLVDNDERATHGTAVAGIMGADGNNTTGITGSNWYTKIMSVLGGSFDEAENIAAYDYILSHKKRYLETNGREGAFVVVINSSWGLRGEFPSSFPIWNSFYDTLGKYGILSVSAATNSNRDAGIFGDMPTLSSSEFLLTVSNTDKDLQPNGGFSDTAVDIYAPGDLTQTLCATSYTFCSRPYRGFNGTSGASPLVAGLVGLIYNYACDSFISLSKSNPEQAVILAKQWILNGVSSNPLFVGKAVSQGIVDYDSTLSLADKWCQSVNPSTDTYQLAKHVLEIYPNPNNGSFNIASSIELESIDIFNVNSQLIWTKDKLNGKKIKVYPYLNQGVYLAVVKTTDGKSQVRRLLIL